MDMYGTDRAAVNYREVVTYLYRLPRIVKGGHMENVRQLLQALGHPERSFYYIHVAGTNGKGSVCAYIERCLRLCQKKTGLFTSPHLIRVNERIRICGKEISDADFVQAFWVIRMTVDREKTYGVQEPTFFEYLYLMAMYYFSKQKVDYAVIEAGMGGGSDYTNVIGKPAVTVLTSVSMDHVPILGSTLPEIAAEKAGVMKSQVPLFCAAQESEVKNIILAACQKQGVRAVFVDSVKIFACTSERIDFSAESGYHGTYAAALQTAAVYQAANAALAVAVLEELWGNFRQDFIQTVTKGLWLTRWPGRMEEVDERLYVDGAHNVAGMEAFVQAARVFENRPMTIIFAVSPDKDYRAMARCLCTIPFLTCVIVTEPQNTRMRAAQDAADAFSAFFKGELFIEQSVSEALKKGLVMRGREGILCCVGSLYLVGSIKERCGGDTDDQL